MLKHNPVPSIIGANPSSGPIYGNVIIAGENLIGELSCKIGNTDAHVRKIASEKLIRVDIPVLSIGEHDITVSNEYGTSEPILFTVSPYVLHTMSLSNEKGEYGDTCIINVTPSDALLGGYKVYVNSNEVYTDEIDESSCSFSLPLLALGEADIVLELTGGSSKTATYEVVDVSPPVISLDNKSLMFNGTRATPVHIGDNYAVSVDDIEITISPSKNGTVNSIIPYDDTYVYASLTITDTCSVTYSATDESGNNHTDVVYYVKDISPPVIERTDNNSNVSNHAFSTTYKITDDVAISSNGIHLYSSTMCKVGYIKSIVAVSNKELLLTLDIVDTGNLTLKCIDDAGNTVDLVEDFIVSGKETGKVKINQKNA
jgi:hypothetical protein